MSRQRRDHPANGGTLNSYWHMNETKTMNLKGKTALVTGGAVRIGSAVSEALAGRGCNVVIHYNRSAGRAKKVAARLRSLGVKAWTVQGDFLSSSNCKRVINESFSCAGKIDILINNAAVFHTQGVVDASENDFRTEFEVNFFAPVMLVKTFAEFSRKGQIINILDQRIASSRPHTAPYTLSKQALAGFSRMAALELAPSITVNSVAPGPALVPSKHKRIREKAGIIPLAGKPTLRDIVRAVLFLLESESITGQIIFVDGGQHLLG